VLGQQLIFCRGSSGLKQEYIGFRGLSHKQLKGEHVSWGQSLLALLLVPSKALAKSLHVLVHTEYPVMIIFPFLFSVGCFRLVVF